MSLARNSTKSPRSPQTCAECAGLCCQHGGSPILARCDDFGETYRKSSRKSSIAGRMWLKRARKQYFMMRIIKQAAQRVSDGSHRLDRGPTRNFQWEFAFISGD